MTIQFENGETLEIVGDPKKVGAAQFNQLRIIAARMTSLCSTPAAIRDKFANIVNAIDLDIESAKKMIQEAYYSCHCAISDNEALHEAFGYIVATPTEAAVMDRDAAKDKYQSFAMKGLTQAQLEEAVGFFLKRLGLD